jgi:hypothetical protein
MMISLMVEFLQAPTLHRATGTAPDGDAACRQGTLSFSHAIIGKDELPRILKLCDGRARNY